MLTNKDQTISFPTNAVRHCKLGEQSSVHTNDLQICYIFLRHTARGKGYLKRY